MTPTDAVQDMLDRLHQTASTYHWAQELAVMAPAWDPVASTDEALKDCVFDHSVSAIRGVKWRHRPEALDAVVAATFEGYMTARYLLGSGPVRPKYSLDPSEASANAQRIDQQIKAISRDDVIRALDGGNRELINRIGLTQARFPLQEMMRKDKSDDLFLTSFCLGVAAAMAEELLFGPLGPDNAPVVVPSLPSVRRPVRR
jgi:hypothetical protein